jgi:hypothetical protein
MGKKFVDVEVDWGTLREHYYMIQCTLRVHLCNIAYVLGVGGRGATTQSENE